MDKLLEQSLLYDFYGELLNEHQRSIYEGYVFDNMSLGEIAEEQGISRQGVHDLVKRCESILREYESKLHLLERFSKAKQQVSRIEALTVCCEEDELRSHLEEIHTLAQELMEEL